MATKQYSLKRAICRICGCEYTPKTRQSLKDKCCSSRSCRNEYINEIIGPPFEWVAGRKQWQ